MKLRYLWLTLLFLFLTACSAPAAQETVASDTAPAVKQAVKLGDQEIPLTATSLELYWNEDNVYIRWTADDGASGEGDSTAAALAGEQADGIGALSGLTRVVLCFDDSVNEGVQTELLQRLTQLTVLESIAIQGSAASLEPLADCAGLRDLHLVMCDASRLPALEARALYLTDCTGVDWDRVAALPALETLGVFGDERPASLEPLAQSPTLLTVYSDFTWDDSYEGELPIVLQGPDAQIPEDVTLPYSQEDIQAFLERDGAKIVFELDTFA